MEPLLHCSSYYCRGMASGPGRGKKRRRQAVSPSSAGPSNSVSGVPLLVAVICLFSWLRRGLFRPRLVPINWRKRNPSNVLFCLRKIFFAKQFLKWITFSKNGGDISRCVPASSFLCSCKNGACLYSPAKRLHCNTANLIKYIRRDIFITASGHCYCSL